MPSPARSDPEQREDYLIARPHQVGLASTVARIIVTGITILLILSWVIRLESTLIAR
jgi:hypothetical protein